jgi:hypothetical protein
MLSTQDLARPSAARAAVCVELIGDLDATLGAMFAETLAALCDSGETDVRLSTRHVTESTGAGFKALEGAVATARRRGCAVTVDPGNRRMRAALSSLTTPKASDSPSAASGGRRHLIIARHAPPAKFSNAS